MRKWLKERLPIQKRAIARLHLEWTMTETQWKHMEGVNTLYHSTKGTVSSNPWDSGISKITDRGKKWWEERDVSVVAVEAERPVQRERTSFYVRS